jgi:histone H3/H4
MAKKGGKKEILVVASKVRDYVRNNGCNTSGEFISELSDVVHCIIDKAIGRAQDNGRKTVQAKDA